MNTLRPVYEPTICSSVSSLFVSVARGEGVTFTNLIFPILSQCMPYIFRKWLETRPYLEKTRNYVIVSQTDGTLPHLGTFNQWLRRYLERHDFEHVTPHGLRHFFTTYLLVKGADVKTVSKLMGHSKTDTTLNIYAALTKEGYDKVEAILNSENKPKNNV